MISGLVLTAKYWPVILIFRNTWYHIQTHRYSYLFNCSTNCILLIQLILRILTPAADSRFNSVVSVTHSSGHTIKRNWNTPKQCP